MRGTLTTTVQSLMTRDVTVNGILQEVPLTCRPLLGYTCLCRSSSTQAIERCASPIGLTGRRRPNLCSSICCFTSDAGCERYHLGSSHTLQSFSNWTELTRSGCELEISAYLTVSTNKFNFGRIVLTVALDSEGYGPPHA